MTLWEIVTVIFTATGLFFFFVGSLGLLRFPDVFCRMHALTKADNLGLGLITLGLLPQIGSLFDATQLIITWALVMIVGAAATFLIADYSLKQGALEKQENDDER